MKKFLSFIKMEFLLNDESFRNWKMILYVSILALTMIASGHIADRKIFMIALLNDQIKMLKSQFIEQRTNLMSLKMETKIAEELKIFNIGPAESPPIKIILHKN